MQYIHIYASEYRNPLSYCCLRVMTLNNRLAHSSKDDISKLSDHFIFNRNSSALNMVIDTIQ